MAHAIEIQNVQKKLECNDETTSWSSFWNDDYETDQTEIRGLRLFKAMTMMIWFSRNQVKEKTRN